MICLLVILSAVSVVGCLLGYSSCLVVWIPLFLDRWCVWSFRPSSPLRLPHLKFLFVCLFDLGESEMGGSYELQYGAEHCTWECCVYTKTCPGIVLAAATTCTECRAGIAWHSCLCQSCDLESLCHNCGCVAVLQLVLWMDVALAFMARLECRHVPCEAM